MLQKLRSAFGEIFSPRKPSLHVGSPKPSKALKAWAAGLSILAVFAVADVASAQWHGGHFGPGGVQVVPPPPPPPPPSRHHHRRLVDRHIGRDGALVETWCDDWGQCEKRRIYGQQPAYRY